MCRRYFGKGTDDTVAQAKVCWFQMHIPNHSLIDWMALLDRLPTKQRLASRGLNIKSSCSFCRREVERGDHLFFGCGYAKMYGRVFSMSVIFIERL
ncbi:hypothetical protein J1N35_002563 [Gossypium stocksii]|uniref:Reverse transcriptase zinc-binding domain-containing protein n=1 Tax=Gossypium stocksii TaxID=47602 RepID=A0A9D3WL88_9ROSI|nr:hypothetical protein J1N35_002563 [Gossypium stocksii]